MKIEFRGIIEARDYARKAGKDLPFVTSKALNDTAEELRRNIGRALPKWIRIAGLQKKAKGQPWWQPGGPFGINILFANKEKLSSTVYSRAPWLELLESGGTKTGPHGIFVAQAPLQPQSTYIPRRMKPKQLLAANGPKNVNANAIGPKVFITPPSGDGNQALLQRFGRGQKLRALYVIKPGVSVGRKTHIYKLSEEKYGKIFSSAMERAIDKYVKMNNG